MIRYPCSACSKILESSDFVAGLPVICRHCHASVVVPRKTIEHPGTVVETGVQVLAPSPSVVDSTLMPLLPATNADDPEQSIALAWLTYEFPRRTFSDFFSDFRFGILQIIIGLAGCALVILLIYCAHAIGLRRTSVHAGLVFESLLFITAGVFLIARTISTAFREVLGTKIVNRLLTVTVGSVTGIAVAWCIWELGRLYFACQ